MGVRRVSPLPRGVEVRPSIPPCRWVQPHVGLSGSSILAAGTLLYLIPESAASAAVRFSLQLCCKFFPYRRLLGYNFSSTMSE